VTFNDQCSTERQLTMDQCDQVCCRSFSGLREVTRYECTAHRPDQIGGSVIRPAPCPSCIVDSDCAGTPSTPFCFSGFCKQCREDADCGGVRCDPSTHTCVVPQ
jgi:hypothetical protein